MPAGQIAIVGAGLMGAGIAQVAARAGYGVLLCDTTTAQLDRAMAAIAVSHDRFVAKNVMTSADAEAARARIVTTTDLRDAASATLVIEAVYEDLDVKRDVFTQLDAITAPATVLATNTTAIPITTIAAATRHPERVVGTHFFSPVPMMRLCELVRGEQTTDVTLAAARSFAENVGKTCIVVERDVAGFVTSRLLIAFVNEAIGLVEAGVATASDIDLACTLGFGHAMGPFATLDLTGLDVIAHAAQIIYDDTGDDRFAPSALLRQKVADGDLGRKTGRGFFDYPS